MGKKRWWNRKVSFQKKWCLFCWKENMRPNNWNPVAITLFNKHNVSLNGNQGYLSTAGLSRCREVLNHSVNYFWTARRCWLFCNLFLWGQSWQEELIHLISWARIGSCWVDSAIVFAQWTLKLTLDLTDQKAT